MKIRLPFNTICAFIILAIIFLSAKSSAQQDAFLQLTSTSMDFPSLSEQDIRYSNQFILHITALSPDPRAEYALQMRIRGQGVDLTYQGYDYSSFQLEKGSQKTLFSSDLANYFDVENLHFSGITKEHFLTHGLREGNYNICFTLIDITLDRLASASNSTCQTLFVKHQKPPVINTPFQDESIALADKYKFTWTTQHISTQPYHYELSIYEQVENVSHEELLTFYRPVVHEKVFGASYVYQANREKLQKNKNYIAFVQAKSKYNNLRFENEGYSKGILFSVNNNSNTHNNRLTPQDCSIDNLYWIGNSHNNTISQAKFDVNGVDVVVRFEDEPSFFRSAEYCNNTAGSNVCGPSLPGQEEFAHDIVSWLNFRLPTTEHFSYSSDLHQFYITFPEGQGINHPVGFYIPSTGSWTYPLVQTYLIPIGDPCDDGNPSTVNDTINEQCDCVGEPVINCVHEDMFRVFCSSVNNVIGVRYVNGLLNQSVVFADEPSFFRNEAYCVDVVDPIGCNQALPDALDLANDLVDYFNDEFASSEHYYLSQGADVFIYYPHSLDPTWGVGYSLEGNIINYPSRQSILLTPGESCDDADPCTINDTINSNCECEGEPAELTIGSAPVYDKNCDYCFDMHPADNGEIESYTINSISVTTYYSGFETLDQLDNANVIFNGIFHFPYYVENESNHQLNELMTDLNAWLLASGHHGSLSLNPVCNSNNFGLSVSDANFNFYMNAIDNKGESLYIHRKNINCQTLTDVLGYNLYPVIPYAVCGAMTTTWTGEGIRFYRVGDGYIEPWESLFVDNTTDCYELDVTCSSGCSFSAAGPDPSCNLCRLGRPCDDLDPCTTNDAIDENCLCVGETEQEIELVTYPVYKKYCDLCFDMDPSSSDPLFTSYQILQMSFNLFYPSLVQLNESDNIDDNGNQIFHFPYQVNSASDNELNKLINDLETWLVNAGMSAQLYLGPFCGSAISLSIKDFTSYDSWVVFNATSNLGDDFNIHPTVDNCDVTSELLGYLLSTEFEYWQDDCGGLANIAWSGGLPTDIDFNVVFIEDLNSCYQLDIECTTGCTYSTTGPGTNCSCIIGAPCDPGPISDHCLAYVYDENCDCIGVTQNFPDSDGDGICDEYDVCPGHDDNLDADEDGTADGCDICACYPDGDLIPSDILLILDNDPDNDPTFCGDCDCSIHNFKFLVDDRSHKYCNYCLAVDEDIDLPSSPSIYFSSITTETDAGIETKVFVEDEQVDSEFFESDYGMWQSSSDPGSLDCVRWLDPSLAESGLYSIKFQGDGPDAQLESENINLENSCQVRVDFSFITQDFDIYKDEFRLQVSTNGGVSYSDIETFNYSIDFQNDIRYQKTVYVDGAFSIKTKFRIQCATIDQEKYLYVDNLIISKLESSSYPCYPTNKLDHFTSFLQSNYFSNGANGDAKYEVENSNNCGPGDFISINESAIGFESVTIAGSGITGLYPFVTPNCNDLYPGEESYLLTADIDCADPSYLWHTGETTESLVIPSTIGGYQVTITCGDGCTYVEYFGKDHCQVGSPCEVVNGDPCYPDGFINAYCECIPDILHAPDTDGDGIPDECDPCPTIHNDLDDNQDGITECQEFLCDCDESPYFEVTEVMGESCLTCFPLPSPQDVELVDNVDVYMGNNVYRLINYRDFFDFPYCSSLTYDEDCLGRPNMSQFQEDLRRWAHSKGWDIYFQPAHIQCNAANAFTVANFPEKTDFKIYYTSDTKSGNHIDCQPSSNYSIYTLSVVVDNCSACRGHNEYVWSDPSLNMEQEPTQVSPYYPGGGYSVTVTCPEDGCVLVLEQTGYCLVGTPCDDGDICTQSDTYDEHCNCVGSLIDIEDTDEDGVPNACDACPGFDDAIDDDHDGYANGCDQCIGYDDDNVPPGVECEKCDLSMKYVNMALIPIDVTYLGMRVADLNDKKHFNFSDYPSEFNNRINYCGSSDPFHPSCDVMVPGLHLLAQDVATFFDQIYGGEHHAVHYQGNWYVSTENIKEIEWWDGSNYRLASLYTFFFGGPCDDNNECSVNDHWNEDCRCIGEALDSDNDCTPDGCDECPGVSNALDVNENGIPDCTEPNIPFDCEGGSQLSICDYYIGLLNKTYDANGVETPVIVPADPAILDQFPRPRMIQKRLSTVVEELMQVIKQENFRPACFGFPDLVNQLEMINNGSGNDQNGIPAFIDVFNDQPRTFYDAGHIKEFCYANPDDAAIRIALLTSLTLEVVNFIERKGQEIACSDGEEGVANIHPGCVDDPDVVQELGSDVYEDEDCVLRLVRENCPVEFKINCDGGCEVVYLAYMFDDLAGDCAVPSLGAECTETVQSCYDANAADFPCGVWEVVGNPEYNLDDGIGEPPCICVRRDDGNQDVEFDVVCDDIDQCPGWSDDDGLPAIDPAFADYDNDGDGIHDCLDGCPNLAGSISDECDDGILGTYNDRIYKIDGVCECHGVYIDADGDGIPEVPDCIGAIDNDQDGYPDEIVDDLTYTTDQFGNITGVVAESDGFPDCDICPGLDDTEMNPGSESGDLPACLNPVYFDVGCPVSFHVWPGQGVVLHFDAANFDYSNIPQPIDVLVQTRDGQSPVEAYQLDFLLQQSSRVVNDEVEVFYPVSNMDENLLNQNIILVGITYAGHQQCVIQSPTTGFVQLGCADEIAYYGTTENLVMIFHPTENADFDPTVFDGGDIEFFLASDVGADLVNASDPTLPLLVSYTAEQITLDDAGNALLTLDFVDLDEMSTYHGSITMLASGATCIYDGGSLEQNCEDELGNPIAAGEACDDGDLCTENDQWTEVDGECICQGTPKPDTDGDGICDDLDQAYVHLMCPKISLFSSTLLLIFNVPPGFTIDPHWFNGTITFDPVSTPSLSLSYNFSNVRFFNESILFVFNDVDRAIDLYGFDGLITLPNGLQCNYSGATVHSNCQDGIVLGDPCDDGDPCTHHDRWIDEDQDGICDCLGEEAYDTDEDGVCDEIDDCPYLDQSDQPDADGDGFPDCPCPDLTITDLADENGQVIIPLTPHIIVIDGNDVEVGLSDEFLADYSHINVVATGGPEDILMEELVVTNPFVISNLPFGYYYDITLTAVCHSGGQSEVSFEVDVPFGESSIICGLELNPVDLSTVVLLSNLENGDRFTASDFDIKVLRATQESMGHFTGTGYIKVPVFEHARFNVLFNNITISADRQMIDGVVELRGFGIAVFGDEISDAIQNNIDGILNTLTELSEKLAAIEDLLRQLEDLKNQMDDLMDEETRQCIEGVKLELENAIQQDPVDEMLIDELTRDLNDCMSEFEGDLGILITGFTDLLIESINKFSTTCNSDISALESSFDANDNHYSDLITVTLDQIKSNWIGGSNNLDPTIESNFIYGDEPMDIPIGEDVDLEIFYRDIILEYDYCNTMIKWKSGFDSIDPATNLESLTKQIKVLLIMLEEIDSVKKEEIAQAIVNGSNTQALFDLFKEDIEVAFKNVIIKKSYPSKN